MADNNDTLVAEVKELTGNVKNMLPKADAAEKTATEAKAIATETKTAVEKVSTEIKVIADNEAERKKREEANQKALNELIVEMKTMREGGIKIRGDEANFETEFAKMIKDNYEEFKTVSKGTKVKKEMSGNASMLMKAAANMTTATDLSGNPVVTFMPKPALLPSQQVNVRDLVPSFQSATLTINLFRESNPTPAQGNFAQQTTEGTLKSQIEYNYQNVSFTAYYIAGFVRFAKQMMYNLPWLQTFLPQQLLRDFYIKENTTLYAQLIAAAVGTSTTTYNSGTPTDPNSYAGKLIQLLANLEGTNFTANGIVVTPVIWAALMLTTVPTIGTGYSIPGGAQITPNGQMMIAGIPIIKANWLTTGHALVGDFNYASIAQVENLKVEFFEQDSDNVERNLITCRVEALEVLVVERGEAFIDKIMNNNT